MPSRDPRSFTWLLAGLSLALLPAWAAAQSKADPESDKKFAAARALLRQRCASCHGAEKQEGGLRLDVGSRALQGGDSGKAIVAGQPKESPLLERVVSTEDERMPPEGEGTPLASTAR